MADLTLPAPVMGLLQRVMRTDQPESTKRFMAVLAGITLCCCLSLLTLAVWYQAVLRDHVDGNLVACLGILSASVAGLAGVAYRKQDPPDATPGAVKPETPGATAGAPSSPEA